MADDEEESCDFITHSTQHCDTAVMQASGKILLDHFTPAPYHRTSSVARTNGNAAPRNGALARSHSGPPAHALRQRSGTRFSLCEAKRSLPRARMSSFRVIVKNTS